MALERGVVAINHGSTVRELLAEEMSKPHPFVASRLPRAVGVSVEPTDCNNTELRFSTMPNQDSVAGNLGDLLRLYFFAYSSRVKLREPIEGSINIYIDKIVDFDRMRIVPRNVFSDSI